MDPIMRAARSFLVEIEERWEESPGGVLPLLAEASDRGELVKALRLGELAPENRWPLFLYEAPFMETSAYFDGLTDAIARDYEAMRAGVFDEGMTLPEFTMNPILLGPLERAALAMERAAALSGVCFDGVTVALVPEQIGDWRAWRESVRALDRMARSPRVRLAVHATPGGPLDGTLGVEGARFHVDPAELLGFLAGQDSGASEGPPPMEPTSVPPPSQTAETARRLRGLMLEAAARMAAQEPTAAAAAYEDARVLCAAEALVMEEAATLMGLGGAYLAAQAPDLAGESYGKAARLAEGAAAWELASLAWLGVGGACLVCERHGAAGTAYRAAARAAKRGGVAELEAEALRMAVVCGAPEVESSASATVPAASPLVDPAEDTLVAAPHVPGPALPFVAGVARPSALVHETPPAPARDGHETAVLGAFVPSAVLPFAPPDTPDDPDDGNATMMLRAVDEAG